MKDEWLLRMGRALQRLVSLQEAINVMAGSIRLDLDVETVPVYNSVNRVVAKDIIAKAHLPFFSRSAVDGYAVRAEDTYGASEHNLIVLKVVGEARFGSTGIRIGPGEAVKIYTGVPLPDGADSVIMFEDVIEEGDRIYVMKSVSRYSNVSLQGEDIQQGKILVKRGTQIEVKHVVALASLGINKIEVYRKMSACVLCIGDELVEPESMSLEDVMAKKLVYNSTGPLLISYIRSLGFVEPMYMGIVRDSLEDIKLALTRALTLCDIVITTGGVGPSKQDLVVEAAESLGGRVVVRGISIRPGRPTSSAILNGKPVFMLSGFPIAAFLGFKFFVLPVIEKVVGVSVPRKTVIAKLVRRVANVAGYTTFVRVKLHRCEEALCAEPLALTGSGTVSTLLESDGVLVVPADVEGFDEGQHVEVELL